MNVTDQAVLRIEQASTMTNARLESIHIGQIAPLGPNGVPSAFVKHPVAGPVEVTPVGLAGDTQADPRVHGGVEKAVYGYSMANYVAWRAEYPQHSALLVPGGFGENLAIEGINESDLCVGDVHAIGSALLQVCQPREPCFKFALRFADKSMPRAMVRNGRSGWYYRVLKTGLIGVGDAVNMHDRPNPDFPFARLVELAGRAKATRPELERMAGMPGLASAWQEFARRRMSEFG
jgi:MOSC domain-containing protein YiiM